MAVNRIDRLECRYQSGRGLFSEFSVGAHSRVPAFCRAQCVLNESRCGGARFPRERALTARDRDLPVHGVCASLCPTSPRLFENPVSSLTFVPSVARSALSAWSSARSSPRLEPRRGGGPVLPQPDRSKSASRPRVCARCDESSQCAAERSFAPLRKDVGCHPGFNDEQRLMTCSRR